MGEEGGEYGGVIGVIMSLDRKVAGRLTPHGVTHATTDWVDVLNPPPARNPPIMGRSAIGLLLLGVVLGT